MNFNPAATSLFFQESDEVIWDSLRNNNKQALAAIYYRYFKILLQKGLQISGERELVKDCIHDLFLEIWINKVNLTTPLSVRAYLTVSLQRKIYRKLRKSRLQRNETEYLPVEHVNSKEDQIISEQQLNDQQYMILSAVNSLSRRQREAIHLKFYAGMSYEEISGKMKISTDAIYNLISKAISNLHKGLTGKAEVTFY
jgi:RNA polymerase sigma factor (sigma-70 family)